MRNLQLYATGSATGTSVANVTVPAATTIKGVLINLVATSITAGAIVRLSFSKVPTNQIATNGAQDPFLEVGLSNNFVTSGMNALNLTRFYPISVSCRQGELIYVHATVAGTITYYVNAIFQY